MQPTYEDLERENKKLSDQVKELTQEVERLNRHLYLCQKVIEESKDIHNDAKTVMKETGTKLYQFAKRFEQPPVRTIADYLGWTKRFHESNSTLPGSSTDDSQSEHSKELDSSSSENSLTTIMPTNDPYLDDMHTFIQEEDTKTKSPHQEKHDPIQHEPVRTSPTSGISSSITSAEETSDYSGQQEPTNPTRTQSTNSLGFTYPIEATLSSSEYESDGDQATLRSNTCNKEIVATPIDSGFFNRKDNWPHQAEKITPGIGQSAKEVPLVKKKTFS